MEEAINHRLILYIKHLGISVRKFESVNNLSNGYVKKSKNRIGQDKLKTISLNYPKLNIEWLMTGKGEMEKDDPDVCEGVDAGVLVRRTKVAPLVPVDIIRKPNVRVWDFVRRHHDIYDRTPDEMMPEFDLAYTMYGNALSPVIDRGDTIYLQWQELSTDSIVNGHVYWLDTKKNGILIKRVYVEDGKLQCYSLMGKQPVKAFSLDELFDIFSVVSILKNSIPNLDVTRERENLLSEVIGQNGALIGELSAHRKLVEKLIDKKL